MRVRAVAFRPEDPDERQVAVALREVQAVADDEAIGDPEANIVDAHPHLERLAPVPFSVVCFRVAPPGEADEGRLERLNAAVLERVNSSGEVFLSHTKLKGRYCLRLAIGNLGTGPRHVDRAFRLTCEAAGLDPMVAKVE